MGLSGAVVASWPLTQEVTGDFSEFSETFKKNSTD